MLPPGKSEVGFYVLCSDYSKILRKEKNKKNVTFISVFVTLLTFISKIVNRFIIILYFNEFHSV